MLFICYERCSTCKKAKEWLQSREEQFEIRDIKSCNPNEKELREWYEKSGLPLRRFFNTSGLLYKSMELKSKLPEMSEEEQLRLLASDGMLVKRPILVMENRVLVGFKSEEWAEALDKEGNRG